MPKINVEGLDRADIVLAFFKNVYKKSESSKKRHAYAIRMIVADDIGIYGIPLKYEIEALLRKKRMDMNYCGVL